MLTITNIVSLSFRALSLSREIDKNLCSGRKRAGRAGRERGAGAYQVYPLVFSR